MKVKKINTGIKTLEENLSNSSKTWKKLLLIILAILFYLLMFSLNSMASNCNEKRGYLRRLGGQAFMAGFKYAKKNSPLLHSFSSCKNIVKKLNTNPKNYSYLMEKCLKGTTEFTIMESGPSIEMAPISIMPLKK